LQQKRLKMPVGHAFGQGNVSYSPRRPKYGSVGVREEKWGLQQKRLKMPVEHAFGQGNVSYSPRRPKYRSGGGPGGEVAIAAKTAENACRARVRPRKREL